MADGAPKLPWRFLNNSINVVKDCGAKGDGKTDDSAAINVRE